MAERSSPATNGLPVAGRGHQNCDATKDSTGIVVPSRFRGTAADQRDMVVLGRKQVLRRNFRFTTILGFASTGWYAPKFSKPLHVVRL